MWNFADLSARRQGVVCGVGSVACVLLAWPALAQRVGEGSSSDRGRLAAIVLTPSDTRLATELASLPAAQAKGVRAEQLLTARASGKSFERALRDKGFTAAEATALVESIAGRVTPFAPPPRAPAARIVEPPTLTFPPRDGQGEYEASIGYESRFDDVLALQQQRTPTYFWYALSPWLAAEIDFDAVLSVGASGSRASSVGDTTLNIKPVLFQQHRSGVPRITATYAIKLPTARTGVRSGITDHIAAVEALRTFGRDYQHLFLVIFETDWIGTATDTYDRSSSLFSRARFLLPWKLAGRHGLESETDAAWTDLSARSGFIRQGVRIRLPHSMKVRAGVRIGVGTGVSNGLYVDYRIGGLWLPRAVRQSVALRGD